MEENGLERRDFARFSPAAGAAMTKMTTAPFTLYSIAPPLLSTDPCHEHC